MKAAAKVTYERPSKVVWQSTQLSATNTECSCFEQRGQRYTMAERAYTGPTSRASLEVSKAVEMLQGLRGRGGLRSACAQACIYLRFPTSLLLSLLVHDVSELLVLLISNKPRCPSPLLSSCSPVRNFMLGRSPSSVSRLPRPYSHWFYAL